jgi:hypothetical protein
MARLTEKLLSYMYTALDQDPERFVAFRARHATGVFSYAVVDYDVTCYVNGVQVLAVSLKDNTLKELTEKIGSLNGMSIVYKAEPDVMDLSACVLMEASGAQNQSNGDIWYGYASLLWIYLESTGRELTDARIAIDAMMAQLSVRTAESEWLDYWGEHFGVPRIGTEIDPTYSVRMITEILRPRENNKAMEAALFERFGQTATVVDSPRSKGQTNQYNGFYPHNGSRIYNGTSDLYYGLFDVVVAYDLLSAASPNTFAKDVKAFLEKFRAAGTNLNSLALSGGAITDTYSGTITESTTLAISVPSLADTVTAPSETFPVMPVSLAILADTFTPGTDSTSATISYNTLYNSVRFFDGIADYNSGSDVPDAWS